MLLYIYFPYLLYKSCIHCLRLMRCCWCVMVFSFEARMKIRTSKSEATVHSDVLSTHCWLKCSELSNLFHITVCHLTGRGNRFTDEISLLTEHKLWFHAKYKKHFKFCVKKQVGYIQIFVFEATFQQLLVQFTNFLL